MQFRFSLKAAQQISISIFSSSFHEFSFFHSTGSTISMRFCDWMLEFSDLHHGCLFSIEFLNFYDKKLQLRLQISHGKAPNWAQRVHWTLISILAQKTRHKLVKKPHFLTNFQELKITRPSLFTFSILLNQWDQWLDQMLNLPKLLVSNCL